MGRSTQVVNIHYLGQIHFFWSEQMDFFACEFYYGLFRILMIKSSFRIDRALFNSLTGHNWF